MSKIYEWDGRNYCDKDLSETDPYYAGNLDDMWEAMKDSGYFHESTYYCTDEYCYETITDLANNECECIGEVDD